MTLRFYNIKVGLFIAAMGVGIALLGMSMAFFRFGMTVGTVGTIAIGLFLLVYGITFLDFAAPKTRWILFLANKLMSLVLVLGIISFIGIEALVYRALTTKDDIPLEYAVIMGAGVQRDQPSLTLKRRLDKGLEYLAMHPESKVVVAGGMGGGAKMAEAEVMHRYLVAHGIATTRIVKEDRSKSSDENLKNTGELLGRLTDKPVREILIITSDYHMFRSQYIAGKYFTHAYGLAAETPSTTLLNYAVREYFAVVKMILVNTLGLSVLLPVR